MKHAHYSPDAYCLVRYQDKVSGGCELLWNARDAEAPPSVLSGNNQTTYLRLRAPAIYSPRFIPEERTRVIINLTQAEAVAEATKMIKADPDLARPYASANVAIELLAKSLMGDGNAPHVVIVDYQLRRTFVRAANAMIGDKSDHAASQGTRRQLLTPEYRQMLNPLEALWAFCMWLSHLPHAVSIGANEDPANLYDLHDIWSSQQTMDPVRDHWDRLVKSVDYPGHQPQPTPAPATQEEPKGHDDGEDAGSDEPTGIRSEADEARSSETEV